MGWGGEGVPGVGVCAYLPPLQSLRSRPGVSIVSRFGYFFRRFAASPVDLWRFGSTGLRKDSLGQQEGHSQGYVDKGESRASCAQSAGVMRGSLGRWGIRWASSSSGRKGAVLAPPGSSDPARSDAPYLVTLVAVCRVAKSEYRFIGEFRTFSYPFGRKGRGGYVRRDVQRFGRRAIWEHA